MFKLQVVMQQNRKNAKGDEYFFKALYSLNSFLLRCACIGYTVAAQLNVL